MDTAAGRRGRGAVRLIHRSADGAATVRVVLDKRENAARRNGLSDAHEAELTKQCWRCRETARSTPKCKPAGSIRRPRGQRWRPDERQCDRVQRVRERRRLTRWASGVATWDRYEGRATSGHHTTATQWTSSIRRAGACVRRGRMATSSPSAGAMPHSGTVSESPERNPAKGSSRPSKPSATPPALPLLCSSVTPILRVYTSRGRMA